MASTIDAEDIAMIADALERVLTDAPLETIDRAGGVGDHAEALWDTFEASGFPSLCVSEADGGAGAGLVDAALLARIGARHALALPLADAALAHGILSLTGVETSVSRIALGDPLDPAMPITHAAQCDAVLALDNGRLRLSTIEPATLQPAHGYEDGAGRIAGDTQQIASADVPEWLSAEVFRALAAYIRAASMAGAMQGVLDLTLTYTSEREQFGRPLSKFQAIQHHLADIACETAAASAAVEMAGDALAADPLCGAQVIEDIAIAKIRCGEAAARVAAAAHQAHGAMGFTREYTLGRYTRRLWQWQDEFGSAEEWAQGLGHAILAAETPVLWPAISRAV